MGAREWNLTAGVILVPLAIAIVVTLWSLEQARYRPKKMRPPGIRRDEPVTLPPEAAAPSPDAASRPTTTAGCTPPPTPTASASTSIRADASRSGTPSTTA